MIRTSLRNPPSTGYRRPQKRRFYVWRCRMTYRRPGHTFWRWCCTLCEPPAYGARTTSDAWYRIISQSLPEHMESRRGHHYYVYRNFTRNGYATGGPRRLQ